MARHRAIRAITNKGFVGCALFLLVLWNEFLHLFFISLTWNTLDDDPGMRSTRILIVADPQLIGYRNEPHDIGPIARWDSDRYLSAGFSRAMSRSSPDIVMFLGDLIDEGVESNKMQFEWNAKRFEQIFALPNNVQRVYVPGDNDVGGEAEPVNAVLVNRFRSRFPNLFDMEQLNLKGVSLSEFNGFNNELRNLSQESSDSLLFMLSHVPMIRSYTQAAKVAMDTKADLILSAHDHRAELYLRPRRPSLSHSFEILDLTERTSPVLLTLSRDDPTVELQSPTCSYRMGVPQMGYGFLTVRRIGDMNDDNKNMKLQLSYTVFWLPGRFPQLYAYVYLLGWLFLLVLQSCVHQFVRHLVRRRTAKGHKSLQP